MTKKFAVILSGCGFLDGSEIRESVLTLLALDTAGVDYDCIAQNKFQFHHINHLTQEEESSQRNLMQESARIARGNIKALENVNPSDYDGCLLPGGYGVAKNLCHFAFSGAESKVDEEITSFLNSFKGNGKPIGALCISPALIALLWGKDGVKVTIGNDKETALEIEKTGAVHQVTEVHECLIDEEHKIVSTAAYMYGEAKVDKIYQGIKSCVDNVIRLA